MRKLLLLIALAAPAFGANGYGHCKIVTVKSYNGGSGGLLTGGSADETNFPLIFVTTDTDLKATGSGGSYVTSSSGYDIAFGNDSCAGGTPALNWEYDLGAASYVAATGFLHIRLKIPTLTYLSDVTTVSMYFGNSGVSTFQGGSTGAAWASAYKGVFHFEETSGTSIADSSANGNTGTSANNVSGKSGTGQVGNAITWNGTSDIVVLTQTAGIPLQSTSSIYSTAFWMKSPSSVTGQMYSEAQTSATTAYYALDGGGVGSHLGVFLRTSGNAVKLNYSSVSTPFNNAWHKIQFVDNNGTARLYVDGAFDTNSVSYTRNGSYSVVYCAIAAGDQNGTPSSFYAGALDEMILSSGTAWTDARVQAEYLTELSPATYISIGSILSSGAIRHRSIAAVLLELAARFIVNAA